MKMRVCILVLSFGAMTLLSLSCAPSLPNAIRDGNTARVAELLGDGTAPDLDQHLLLAADCSQVGKSRSDRSETLRLLLQAGASSSACDATGRNALQVAAKGGCAQSVQILLDSGFGSLIDARDTHGQTALILAAGEGHKEVVEILVQRGSDLTLRDKWIAMFSGSATRDGVTESSSKVYDQGRSALDWAVANGHEDVAELLRNTSSNR